MESACLHVYYIRAGNEIILIVYAATVNWYKHIK